MTFGLGVIGAGNYYGLDAIGPAARRATASGAGSSRAPVDDGWKVATA